MSSTPAHVNRLGYLIVMTRVRIPPSPTGLLHIGTARTALFNILFARQSGGVAIFRMEDTDKERSTKEFERDIIEGLQWLGLTWDEGLEVGGPHAPYRQSERTAIYQPYIQKLLDTGRAYYCFCTTTELDAQRQKAIDEKHASIYDGTCARLSAQEVAERVEKGIASTIRLRVPAHTIGFHDLIRGDVEFDTSLIGDIIVAKDIKTPLYHLAVVIDDYEMNITHVIRGEDHISNTPKQILIIEALGFTIPIYAHLPLILDTDRSKMSKRRNKVSLIEYRKDGYLPEAMINFMAFLGWNPGTDVEIMSLEEIIKQFTFERVQKSGAVFNLEKLQWINSQYIRALSLEELTVRTIPFLIDQEYITLPIGEREDVHEYTVIQTGETISRTTLTHYISLERERAKTLAEIPSAIAFCFAHTLTYDPALLSWKDTPLDATREMLLLGYDILKGIEEHDFIASALEEVLKAEIAHKELKNGMVLWPLRVALSGQKNSPSPFEIASVIGKEKTLQRIQQAISKIVP